MLKNYFKTAWRNLLRNKFYSLINIAGLTTGLAVGILILLWVHDERSFDTFHKKTAEIYRMELWGGTGTSKQILTETVGPMGPMAKKEFPEVSEAVRLSYNYYFSLYRYRDEVFSDENVYVADPAFFTLFDFPLIEGNSARPFADAHSVVITRKTARKFFGAADALGKVIAADDKEEFTVTGVIADFPENTAMRFDMVMPMALMAQKQRIAGDDIDHDFDSYQYITFLQLRPGTSIRALEKKLNKLHLSQKPEDTDADYLLLPLAKMHLYNADGSDAGVQTVHIFTIIALLILSIACINYVNLSTARAMLRAKEVSMRKIVGAAKVQLFLQFVVETALLFLLAAGLAVALVWVAMPLFDELSGKQLVFRPSDPQLWTIIGITILATLAASSIYPALLLSSFDPLKALKTKLSISRGDAWFRKTLVVIQFAASVILISGTLVIYRQLHYIRSKDLGYDKSHVFSFWMRDMSKYYESAKTALLRQTGVEGVTTGSGSLVDNQGYTGYTYWDGKAPGQTFFVHPMWVDKDFLSFFRMQLIAGRGFTGTAGDSTHFVFNETAIRELGFKDPIGKSFKIGQTQGTIVGIVKDFHYMSMKKKIEPAVFLSDRGRTITRMYVRTKGENAATAIETARLLFKQYNNDYPFSYTFLDDSFNKLYRSEEREGALFFYFAGIAILISCLGLFALAAYTSYLRFREIGIRKVLGASAAGIVRLLAQDFIRLVAVGILIAVPVAWYAMGQWLAGFAYRTALGWTVFVLAALITLAIAILTISFQALKAALANPVQSLQSE